MAKFKIELNKDTCIGCGACTAQCDNFEMDGDKAKIIKTEVDDVSCNKEAEDVCPVDAIKVKEI
jgi:ferredoxin